MGFHVKEEVRMGLGFDWAVMEVRWVVKGRRRVGRKECDEEGKKRILRSRCDEGSDLYKCL